MISKELQKRIEAPIGVTSEYIGGNKGGMKYGDIVRIQAIVNENAFMTSNGEVEESGGVQATDKIEVYVFSEKQGRFARVGILLDAPDVLLTSIALLQE